jgi:hypothetical protein
MPQRLRITVQEVCIDMYEGHTGRMKKDRPGVQIAVGRFHYLKNGMYETDSLRNFKKHLFFTEESFSIDSML